MMLYEYPDTYKGLEEVKDDNVFSDTLLADIFKGPTPQLAIAGKILYDKQVAPEKVQADIDARKDLLNKFDMAEKIMPTGIISTTKRLSAHILGFMADPLNLLAFRAGGSIVGKLSDNAVNSLSKRTVALALAKSAQEGATFGIATTGIEALHAVESETSFHDDFNTLDAMANIGINSVMGLSFGLVGHLGIASLKKILTKNKDPIAKEIPDIPEIMKEDVNNNTALNFSAITPEAMKTSFDVFEAQAEYGNRLDNDAMLQDGFNKARSLENPSIEKIDSFIKLHDDTIKVLEEQKKEYIKKSQLAWDKIPDDQKLINANYISKMLMSSKKLPETERTQIESLLLEQKNKETMPEYIQRLSKSHEIDSIKHEDKELIKSTQSMNEAKLINAELEEINKISPSNMTKKMEERKNILNNRNSILEKHTNSIKHSMERNIKELSTKEHNEFYEATDSLMKARETIDFLKSELEKAKSVKIVLNKEQTPLNISELLANAKKNLNGMNDELFQNNYTTLSEISKNLPEPDDLTLSKQDEIKYNELELSEQEIKDMEELEIRQEALPIIKEMQDEFLECINSLEE